MPIYYAVTGNYALRPGEKWEIFQLTGNQPRSLEISVICDTGKLGLITDDPNSAPYWVDAGQVHSEVKNALTFLLTAKDADTSGSYLIRFSTPIPDVGFLLGNRPIVTVAQGPVPAPPRFGSRP